MKYGLLGEKLSHSFSPQIHNKLVPYSYELFEVAPQNIAAFLSQKELAGCNVTIPYKQTVIPYLDEASAIAKRIGAVNTIVRRGNGTLYGDNTDYDGLLFLVQQLPVSIAGKKVVILGSGGTSKTATVLMEDLGAKEIAILSRNGGTGYADLPLHIDAEIIINTTPVGMYPHNGNTPIDLANFPMTEAVIDVIYNPLCTQLVLNAKEGKIPSIGGLGMLVAQAHKAAELFTGHPIPSNLIESILNDLVQTMQNIVIVGMPGSGKSSIGAKVAELLERPFIDIDDQITAHAQKTVPEIFAQDGEAAFRQMERDTIAEFGKKQGLVIATGGGAVLDERNYAPLAQNGRIYHLKRAIESLATQGRPLSLSANSLAELYTVRKPYYTAFAHSSIENRATIIDAAKRICEDFYEHTCD